MSQQPEIMPCYCTNEIAEKVEITKQIESVTRRQERIVPQAMSSAKEKLYSCSSRKAVNILLMFFSRNGVQDGFSTS
jgi:hypothetical protein